MVPLLLLNGVWLLVFSLWPHFGLCSNSAKITYLCGQEGVQIQVPPSYLGADVTFLVRDEFGMAYDFNGCVSKCVFSAKKPNGENIFFVSYQICISFQQGPLWHLRVRLVGSMKTEDLNITCSKERNPRVLTHKPKPRKSTTVPIWTSPLASTSTKGYVVSPTRMLSTKTSFIQGEGDFKTTTSPAKTFGTKEPDVVMTSPFPVVEHKTTSIPPPISPDILNKSQCIVPSERVSCLDSSVSRDTCLSYRCCHDPTDPITPCYYGHTVSANCPSDGSFQLVISRYATNPPLLLSSLVVGLGTCPPPVIKGDFLVIKGQLQACTTTRFVQGQLTYELAVTAKQDILVSPLGSITRDSTFTLTAKCPYNITLSFTLVSVVEPPPPLPSVTNSGVLDIQLRIAKDSAFSEYYTSRDYPLQIPLRELIHFETKLLQPSDPRLHLRLHHCWATPSLDPASTIRWPLIYDGCPFADDDPLTNILPGPVPSSYQRFVVSAFMFRGFQSQSQVFVFCSVSVCVPSSNETCTSDCSSLKRGRRFEPDFFHQLVKTAGPLVFQQETETGLAIFQDMTTALPVILFAVALLVVLCLVFVLNFNFMAWFRGHLNVT